MKLITVNLAPSVIATTTSTTATADGIAMQMQSTECLNNLSATAFSTATAANATYPNTIYNTDASQKKCTAVRNSQYLPTSVITTKANNNNNNNNNTKAAVLDVNRQKTLNALVQVQHSPGGSSLGNNSSKQSFVRRCHSNNNISHYSAPVAPTAAVTAAVKSQLASLTQVVSVKATRLLDNAADNMFSTSTTTTTTNNNTNNSNKSLSNSLH